MSFFKIYSDELIIPKKPIISADEAEKSLAKSYIVPPKKPSQYNDEQKNVDKEVVLVKKNFLEV